MLSLAPRRRLGRAGSTLANGTCARPGSVHASQADWPASWQRSRDQAHLLNDGTNGSATPKSPKPKIGAQTGPSSRHRLVSTAVVTGVFAGRWCPTGQLTILGARSTFMVQMAEPDRTGVESGQPSRRVPTPTRIWTTILSGMGSKVQRGGGILQPCHPHCQASSGLWRTNHRNRAKSAVG